ncbi:MAG: GntR family transcriptional regulator [Bacteroidetes bacterium GWF2_42_66]|nr:MAG: GntR family transcriptional regulator [Bacteroidetes bacterium GWA2_42_15]OFX96221.1 MAG: GntR family transcriptional regulator [Bacteroidetes bacterium GWE2_42_39]OFY46260.1 MAG: GntR family transcriptional regulator [Bacteroidetes bacterium GWF2_42_66]HBL78367.1 GntR family transcriptional regulator [Prolixibacteraceae bacterium]HCR90766.1 GntR family transcriptional regulator [Prolixibacteraceae bacterium]
MKLKIGIDTNSQTPVYKQLIQAIQDLVNTGEYHEGEFIPSMNELANELDISKETVKKAYSILREKGVIESSHGKGFYVTNGGNTKIKVLLLFDKISTYKQVLFSSFSANIGDISEITIRLHNQDVDLFEHFIDENLDHFDYYIITPHFPIKPEIQKRTIKILKKIPNRKLILLDHLVEELPGNFGSVYQDFEQDIFDGLTQSIGILKNFKKLNVISMPGSLYAPLIEKGIQKFCMQNQVDFEIHKNIDTDKIQKQEVFLILNSQLDHELIELVRAAKMKGCTIGQDIGIISYNESPINEIILDGLTVFSTDFNQMGELAAKMIMAKSFKKIKCDFRLIRRNTF